MLRSIQFICRFSEYFVTRDKLEIAEYYQKITKDRHYVHYTTFWKRELEKKHRRRERQKELERQREEPQPQESKLVIHNPLKGIEQQSEIFAICEINSRQFKVLQDDLIVSELMEGVDINQQVTFNNVLLIASKDYTLIGRPYIENAKILATVEQQTWSEKEIILKKKRRKRYMRNYGHRQPLTVLRIDKIIHELQENHLNRAIALI
ncbi:hypothetical protein pb186bvf_011397 [Paramecium bursaria]